MKSKLIFMIIVLLSQVGCVATSSLISVGKNWEGASSYKQAFFKNQSLYLSYELTGDSSGTKYINFSLADKQLEYLNEFPVSLQKKQELSIQQISPNFFESGIMDSSLDCPSLYLLGRYEDYKFISECSTAKILETNIPAPTGRGRYRAWWSIPVIAIGIAPAVVFDIISFPFIAPKVLSEGMSVGH